MRRVLCYTCVVSFVVYALRPRGGEFYGAGSHHRTAGRRFVPADRHRHGSGQDRCTQAGKQAGAFQPAGLHHCAGHGGKLLPYGVQRPDLAQSAGSFWHERSVCAAGHSDHPAAHGAQDRQPDAHFPVCLHLFQCGIHGLPAYFGAVRLRGSFVCQRLCCGRWATVLSAAVPV